MDGDDAAAWTFGGCHLARKERRRTTTTALDQTHSQRLVNHKAVASADDGAAADCWQMMRSMTRKTVAFNELASNNQLATAVVVAAAVTYL